ncbi:MAG TPA: glycosyltransferase family 4 protein [Tepidisphaeraceae bacterium]|jgi:glycosyltransferase involved in cell wall biosynthesis
MYTPSASGGHALYTRELMTALARHADADRRFELVTSDDLADEFRTDAYPIHAILPRLRHRKQFRTPIGWAVSRALHYPRRERTLLNWLKTRPDVTGVHFQEYKPWLARRLFGALKASGRRIYYTVHNLRPHDYPPGVPKRLMDHWNHQSWRMCDGLFVHTERLAGELAELLGKSHPPIHVSPHGTWTVDRPVEVPTVEERLRWKRLLFFGTIRRNKGLDLLLQAAEELPGYSITVAGETGDYDYYNGVITPQVQRLRDRGMAVDVRLRFTPEAEVGPLLAAHSAIVLPYTRKFMAQSGVVFLALAHEMPVVASEVGGLRDLFGEFEIGTTFDDLTPHGLASAVRRLFDHVPHGDLAAQIRAARRRYSWSAAAEATLAGYGMAPAPVLAGVER